MDFGDEEEGDGDVIIDEEELTMLKTMKDLKREYRTNFGNLKVIKQELKSLQDQIDMGRERMISQFERWYETEFEFQQN